MTRVYDSNKATKIQTKPLKQLIITVVLLIAILIIPNLGMALDSSIVFDPTNLATAKDKLEVARQELEHDKTMAKDLSNGKITPDILDTIENVAYSCGFKRVQLPDIAKYIPDLSLNNVCSNPTKTLDHISKILKKNYFFSKDDDDTTRTKKRMTQDKVRKQTRAISVAYAKMARLESNQTTDKLEKLQQTIANNKTTTAPAAIQVLTQVNLVIASNQVTMIKLLSLLLEEHAE